MYQVTYDEDRRAFWKSGQGWGLVLCWHLIGFREDPLKKMIWFALGEQFWFKIYSLQWKWLLFSTKTRQIKLDGTSNPYRSITPLFVGLFCALHKPLSSLIAWCSCPPQAWSTWRSSFKFFSWKLNRNTKSLIVNGKVGWFRKLTSFQSLTWWWCIPSGLCPQPWIWNMLMLILCWCWWICGWLNDDNDDTVITLTRGL